MKKPSTDLYDLIHSLSKAEKRYIRLEAKGVQGLALMDALLEQEKYDEALLKKEFARAAFIKNLAVSKKYLNDLILKLLDRFVRHDVLEVVKKGTGQARILINRGLFKACRKQVIKYKKIAYENELFEQVLDLLKIEKQLLSTAFKIGDIETIFQEEKNCLQKISNTNTYWALAGKLYDLQKKYQKVNRKEMAVELSSLASRPELKDKSLAETLQSKMYYYQANATLHFTQGNPKKALHYNAMFLQFFESEPSLLQRFPERYLSTLNNYLIDNAVLENYDALTEGLEKLNTIPKQAAFQKIKDIEVRIFRQRYLLEINWRLGLRDYENGVKLIPALEEGLEAYGDKIEKYHLITFYYLGASLFFGNQQYNEALEWVNKIRKDTREKIVQEIYQFARVLNLMIHERLENLELLESLLPTTRRYLREKRPLYQTEKRLFKYFKVRVNRLKTKELPQIQESLKKDLAELKKIKSESRVFNYLDFEAWFA